MSDHEQQQSDEERLSAQDLAALLTLQDFVTKIKKLKADLERKPRELRSMQRQLDAQQEATKVAHDTVVMAQKRIDAMTVESGVIEADILKLDGQLFSLKSNDEFNAMKLQIKHRKEKNDGLQDEILELMEAIEGLRETQKGEEEELADVQRRFDKTAEAIRGDLTRIKARIEELGQERLQAAEALRAEYRSVFDDVLRRRDELGIAVIEDEICRGCDTRVTSQTLNAVLAQRFVQCPHCDRILHVDF